MANKLYGHYTSQKGLLGIIGSESLWATNIKFLNDEHEFQHALDLIKDIIPHSNIKTGHKDYDTYKEYIEELSKQLKSLDNYKSESIFTLSFSEETDLLSQWRGYCPDNNGFCIIYDIDTLFEEIKSQYEDAHLVQCVYDEDTKKSQIKEVLNRFWSEYYSKKNKKEKKNVIEQLSKEIMLLASYFKHSSFSEEREYRIVVILEYAPDNDLKFREGKFSIIPYLELGANRKHIKNICIGPTSNKNLSRRALETFLDKHYELPVFFGDMEITHSKTPYRPW
jgi:hypothetical protein